MVTLALPPRPDHRVLVLNRLWQPVNIVGTLRAMSLLFRGRASVVHSDESGHRILRLLNGLLIPWRYRRPQRRPSVRRVSCYACRAFYS